MWKEADGIFCEELLVRHRFTVKGDVDLLEIFLGLLSELGKVW